MIGKRVSAALRRRRGATAVEYALLLFLLAMAVTGALVATGGSVDTVLDTVTDTLTGTPHYSVAADDGSLSVPVTVRLSRALPDDAAGAVHLHSEDGTAIAGTDYDAIDTQLDFPPGTLERNLVLTGHPGSGARDLALVLSDPVGAEIATGRVTVTLPGDAPAAVAVGFTDGGTLVLAETDPATPVSVTVALSSARPVDTAVTLQWTAGTASLADLSPLPVLTIPAGSLDASLDVSALPDPAQEDDETATLRIVAADGAQPSGTVQRAVQIPANGSDPVLVLSGLPEAPVPEGQTVPLAATLDHATFRTVTATLTVAGNTASAEDWALGNGDTAPLALSFAPGQVSRPVSLQLRADNEDEPEETVDLALSAPTGATLGTPASGSVAIAATQATAGTVAFESGDPLVLEEGASPQTVTLVLDAPVAEDVQVTLQWQLEGLTEAADFSALPSPFTIPAGQQSASFDVSAVDDGEDEGREGASLAIVSARTADSAAPLQIGETCCRQVTIPGAAAGLTVSFVDPPTDPLHEGERVSIGVALSGLVPEGEERPVTVAFSNGNASNADYTLLFWSENRGNGPFTIPFNEYTSSEEFEFFAKTDSVANEGDETVTVTLQPAEGVSVKGPSSIVLHIDDAGSTSVQFASDALTLNEADGIYGFVVGTILSQPRDRDVLVELAWEFDADDTADAQDIKSDWDDSTAGDTTIQPVLIGSGSRADVTTLWLTDDGVPEPTETAHLRIVSAADADGRPLAIGARSRIPVTIVDQPEEPDTTVLSIQYPPLPTSNLVEGTHGVFHVRLNRPATEPAQVTLGWQPSSANPASAEDFVVSTVDADGNPLSAVTLPLTVNFAVGEDDKAFDLAVVQDNVDERAEETTLLPTNVQGATNGTPYGMYLRILAQSTSCSSQIDTATYIYGYRSDCTRPLEARCYRAARPAQWNSPAIYEERDASECGCLPPGNAGYYDYYQYFRLASGPAPSASEVAASCNLQPTPVTGWTFDDSCSQQGQTVACHRYDDVSGQTETLPDSACTTPASDAEATRARAIGLYPTGPKPDPAQWCATGFDLVNVSTWRYLKDGTSLSPGNILAAPGYSCAAYGTRLLTLACMRNGQPLDASDGACAFAMHEWIAAQRGQVDGLAQFTQLAGNGLQVAEQRGFTDDPMLFDGCTYKISKRPVYQSDPGWGSREGYGCYRTNGQDPDFTQEMDLHTGEKLDSNQSSVYEPINGVCLYHPYEWERTGGSPEWINFLGLPSSPNAINRPRTYCYSAADSLFEDGICGAMPNPGYYNTGHLIVTDD